MRPRRPRRRVILRTVVLLLLMPIGYVGWDMGINHNLWPVRTDRIYRAGQMPARMLTTTIQDHRIHTVLNLRGSNPKQAWYRDELAATTRAGATQVDVAMSSCEWMSRAQLKALVKVLDTCRYPLLIHCQQGSERTGLVSAFVELLRPGSTIEDAERQFSIGYLYFGVKDGKVMTEHLDQYKDWLAEQGWTHSPERFRIWVDGGFRPGTPSREQWPYDPYPLVVITRPVASTTVIPSTATRKDAGVLKR